MGTKVDTSLSYSQTWGVGGEYTKSVTLGSTSGVSIELDPGKSVIAALSASRGSLKVRVWYNAYLTGKTAVNYNPTYKGHHFWGLGISGVMSKGGVSNSVVSTEDIEVGLYFDSKIELKDKETNSVVASYMMSDKSGH